MVAINLRGISVETARCTCTARLGESCSHIGSLLFNLKAGVRAGFTKKACTDVACMWNQDFVKKIKPDKIANMKIYSQKAIVNFKTSEIKTISFSGTRRKMKILTCFCPDCQSLNVNQLYLTFLFRTL